MKPACIIALHGLGANGADLADLPQMMGLADVSWLFPNAPSLAVTVNDGMVMPAWFDIFGFAPDAPVDAQGIAQSVASIHALIDAQLAKGVASESIVLLGFSQGGVIALHAALSYSQQLGGVIGLSTWLPIHERLLPLPADRNNLPVWLGHGEWDNVVPLAAAQIALARLITMGLSPQLETYMMAHSISQSELNEVAAWCSSF